MTTLSSKIVNVHKKKMAKIAVDAVMAVANLDRNDVNFDMIKVRKLRKAPLSASGCGGGMTLDDARGALLVQPRPRLVRRLLSKKCLQ